MDDEELFEPCVIPRHLAGDGATAANTCVVVARGRSMTGDGISPGDELIVRVDLPPKPGSICVIRVSGGPASVKRLAGDGRTLLGTGVDGSVTAVEVLPLDVVTVVGVVVRNAGRDLYGKPHGEQL